MSAESDMFEQGSKAVRRLAIAEGFQGVVAILALFFGAVLVFWLRMDMREERTAFIEALRENTQAVRELSGRVERLERLR